MRKKTEKENKKISLLEFDSLINKKLFFIIVFMFIFCLFLFFLYVIGNYNDFLDSTQKIILYCLSGNSIFLGFCSFLGLIVSIILITKKNKTIKRVLTLIFMIVLIIFSISMTFIAYILDYLSMGLSI